MVATEQLVSTTHGISSTSKHSKPREQLQYQEQGGIGSTPAPGGAPSGYRPWCTKPKM